MSGSWLQDQLAQEVLEGIDSERMWETVKYFSTLNRDSGKADEHRACRYIAQELAAAGVPVEVHEFQAYLSHPVSGGVAVFSPRRQEFVARTHSFSGSTPVEGVQGEVVFIGTPEFEPGLEMDASLFERVDLKGKIVLSEGLVRPWKALAAERKGALALINANLTDQRHNMIISNSWGTPGPDDLGQIPTIPVVSLNRADGQALMALCRQGRVRAAVKAETETGWFPLLLPVARIQGRDPDRFILVHGHIDSWHVGVTDNATGNATKLELARLFQRHRDKLETSLVFAWWPGHSTGRYAGSTWFSDHFWQTIFDQAVTDFNVDSTGVRGATDLAPKASYELWPFVREVVAGFVKNDPSARTSRLTSLGRQGRHADQSFWSNCGANVRLDCMIPDDHPDRAKVGGSGGAWWWHTEHDTLDKGDPDLLVRDTRLLGLTVALLANSAVHPFDHREVAGAFVKRLRRLQETAKGGYDFSASLKEAEGLMAAGQALFDQAEKARQSGDAGSQKAINQVMLTLNRLLTPALLIDVSPFRHQPANPYPDLPGLSPAAALPGLEPAGDQARFIKAQLKREENRIIHALIQARRIIQACL